MKMFDAIPCVVLSMPIVETEQPFMMTFDVRVNGDVMQAAFFGEFARTLRNNIRAGDRGVIREASVQGNKIGFTFMHLEPSTAVGRNVDIIA